MNLRLTSQIEQTIANEAYGYDSLDLRKSVKP